MNGLAGILIAGAGIAVFCNRYEIKIDVKEPMTHFPNFYVSRHDKPMPQVPKNVKKTLKCDLYRNREECLFEDFVQD